MDEETELRFIELEKKIKELEEENSRIRRWARIPPQGMRGPF